MDPRVRLGLVAAVGLLAILLERPLALGALCALCALPWLLRPPPARVAAGLLLTCLGLVWGTALSQGLFSPIQPRVVLVDVGPVELHREGLRYGAAQSLRFVAGLLAGLAVARSTPPDRLLAALRALRVPPGLALLVAAALRFLPVLAQEWAAARAARAGRVGPPPRWPPGAALLAERGLLVPVLARAARRAVALAEAMDARGVDPGAPLPERRPLRARPLDVGVAVGAALLVGGVAAGRVLFWLYVQELWAHPGLRPVYAAVRSWG
jgi:energy-coupling factor transport system permease protein